MTTTISRSTDATTIQVEIVLAPYTAADEPQTILHRIIGSSTIDVTLRPAQPGEGSMQLLFPTFAAASAARTFHRAAATFTVTSTDMAAIPAPYVPRAVGVEQYDQDRDMFTVDVRFQELQ